LAKKQWRSQKKIRRSKNEHVKQERQERDADNVEGGEHGEVFVSAVDIELPERHLPKKWFGA